MNRKIFLLILFIFLGFSGWFILDPPGRNPSAQSLDLVYYSDYFSFVGKDDHGSVAFAMDNNRGKDGNRYQAEHFLVFYDEQEGWVELSGNGRYENKNKELKGIPDSFYYKFSGSPAKGFVIKSGENGLTLRIKPITIRLTRSDKEGLYRMGSSDALLEWKDRTIKGRIIYEYLYKTNFNRLTRGSAGVFKDFHGIYLRVNEGGDLYFHHRRGKPSSITINQDGFLFLNGQTIVLPFSKVTASKYRQGFGFYRWPMAWKGKISFGGEPAIVEIDIEKFKVIKTWIIGGFAMGIVRGTLQVGEVRYPLYGFAELII